jgi:hypothetical protein
MPPPSVLLKGLRLYEWARLPIGLSENGDFERWLLFRRSLRDPKAFACNIFVDRLWRSLKYECVCLHAWSDGRPSGATSPSRGSKQRLDLCPAQGLTPVHSQRLSAGQYEHAENYSSPD